MIDHPQSSSISSSDMAALPMDVVGRIITICDQISSAKTDLRSEGMSKVKDAVRNLLDAGEALNRLGGDDILLEDRVILKTAIAEELKHTVDIILNNHGASADAANALRTQYLIAVSGSTVSWERLRDALQQQVEARAFGATRDKRVIVWRAVRDATKDMSGLETLYRAAVEHLKHLESTRRIPVWLVLPVGLVLIGISALAFWLTRPGPQIRITGVEPKSVTQTDSELILRVTGENFAQGAQIFWNTDVLTATDITTASLRVQIPSHLVASPGEVRIKAIVPDKGESNEWPFQVYPRPTATPTVPTPTPTRTPTPTFTNTPTATPTATATPIVGGLGCTLQLTGPEGARTAAKLPLNQIITDREATVDIVWEKLRLDPTDEQDCVPDEKGLQAITQRAFRLNRSNTMAAAPIQPDKANGQLRQVSGSRLLNLVKTFAIDARNTDIQPGRLDYVLEYQIAADKWEPVRGISLTLEWGLISAVTPTPTRTPTPSTTPTPVCLVSGRSNIISLIEPIADYSTESPTTKFKWSYTGPELQAGYTFMVVAWAINPDGTRIENTEKTLAKNIPWRRGEEVSVSADVSGIGFSTPHHWDVIVVGPGELGKCKSDPGIGWKIRYQEPQQKSEPKAKPTLVP